MSTAILCRTALPRNKEQALENITSITNEYVYSNGDKKFWQQPWPTTFLSKRENDIPLLLQNWQKCTLRILKNKFQAILWLYYQILMFTGLFFVYLFPPGSIFSYVGLLEFWSTFGQFRVYLSLFFVHNECSMDKNWKNSPNLGWATKNLRSVKSFTNSEK